MQRFLVIPKGYQGIIGLNSYSSVQNRKKKRRKKKPAVLLNNTMTKEIRVTSKMIWQKSQPLLVWFGFSFNCTHSDFNAVPTS